MMLSVRPSLIRLQQTAEAKKAVLIMGTAFWYRESVLCLTVRCRAVKHK
jgi:hypothetical protein